MLVVVVVEGEVNSVSGAVEVVEILLGSESKAGAVNLEEVGER